MVAGPAGGVEALSSTPTWDAGSGRLCHKPTVRAPLDPSAR